MQDPDQHRDMLVLWRWNEALSSQGETILRSIGSQMKGVEKGDRLFICATKNNELFLLGAIEANTVGRVREQSLRQEFGTHYAKGESLNGPFRILPLKSQKWRLRFQSEKSDRLSPKFSIGLQLQAHRYLSPESALILEHVLTVRSSRVPFTPPDDDLRAPPEIRYASTRKVRNTAKGDELKWLYERCCQVCRYVVRVPSEEGGYTEVHHLRPLGGDHGGLDNWNNMLVLCANCHAEFDTLAIAINPATGRIVSFDWRSSKHGRKLFFRPEHTLDLPSVKYHWRRFCHASG